ncbi:MAG: LCP family protein [Armatimonadetes bacterium]|nr:LCP family protein [Armatimonadota bacterium]MDW8121020.1 LCP family protein [Armatimonadota bacterium]
MRKIVSFADEDPDVTIRRALQDLRKQRRQAMLMRIGLTALVALLAGLGILFGLSAYWKGRGEPTAFQRIARRVAETFVPADYAFAGRDRLNILVIGADLNYDRKGKPLPQPARSDTILIVSLHRSGQAAFVSIPRDTVVRVRGHYRKINAIHAADGPQALQEVLAQEFGIETHHFVQVTYEGFIKWVDILGGVDIFVDHDLHYDDNWGKLHIHLNRGWHRLNGEQAIGYVRYRKGPRKFCKKCGVKIEHWDPTGDTGRIARQHKFLKAILEKIRKENLWSRLPRLAAVGYEYVTTDLSLRSVLSLANFVRNLRLEDVETAVLPGEFTNYSGLGTVMVVDVTAGEETLSRLLGYTFNPLVWRQGIGSLFRLAKATRRGSSRSSAWHQPVNPQKQSSLKPPTDTQTKSEPVPLVGDLIILEPSPNEEEKSIPSPNETSSSQSQQKDQGAPETP